MKDFFRSDLKLNTKWWHRLIKVGWFLSLLLALLIFLDTFSPRYRIDFIEKGTLVDRIKDDDIHRAFELLNAKKEGWYPVKDYTEGLYLFQEDAIKDRLIEYKTDLFTIDLYCSKNWDENNVAKLRELKEWVAVFDGDMKIGVGITDNPSDKIIAKNIKESCVGIDGTGILKINQTYDPSGKDREFFVTGGYAVEIKEPNKFIITLMSILKVTGSMLLYTLITMIIYYKAVIYIIYGSKKEDDNKK